MRKCRSRFSWSRGCLRCRVAHQLPDAAARWPSCARAQAATLPLCRASESPGTPVQTDPWTPPPESLLWLVWSENLRICISHKFPSVGRELDLENHRTKGRMWPGGAESLPTQDTCALTRLSTGPPGTFPASLPGWGSPVRPPHTTGQNHPSVPALSWKERDEFCKICTKIGQIYVSPATAMLPSENKMQDSWALLLLLHVTASD